MKKVAFLIGIAILSIVSFINETPFSSASCIGYEFLDNNEVFHMWNQEDDYYFNATSGMQFTNHYEDYWSKNVFCGGYYTGWTWNKLACVDELPFSWVIETDNDTYINITGWRNVNYLDYDMRIALRYSLEDTSTRLTIEPYIKNIGDENIPVDLGFAWHIRNIQIDNQEENNTLIVEDKANGYNHYELNGLNFLNTTNVSAIFIMNNDTNEHIFMAWNDSLTYALNVTPFAGQYNSPVTLGIKIGQLNIGQEKKTQIEWVDADPTCENIGNPAYNDGVCYADQPVYTSPHFSNFSDSGISPNKFKITTSISQPDGCSYACLMYSKAESDSSWTFLYSGIGATGCYNKELGSYPVLHTRVYENSTSFDLCIYYYGAECDPKYDLQIFCGFQYNVGSYGDLRHNMSNNYNSSTAENVTIYHLTGFNYTLDYNFSDADTPDWGDAEGGRNISWYIDDDYNATFDGWNVINETDVCGTNLTAKVKVWDDSYFSPTGNEVFNWSDVSFTISPCELPSYYYKIAIIVTFLGTGIFLIAWATKLDNEHKPVKLLLIGFALFLFLYTFSMADLFNIEAIPLGGVYGAFLYMTIFLIALIIILYIKNLFIGMKVKTK